MLTASTSLLVSVFPRGLPTLADQWITLLPVERLLEKCGSSANGDNVSTGDANAPPASTTSAP